MLRRDRYFYFSVIIIDVHPPYEIELGICLLFEKVEVNSHTPSNDDW